MFIIYRENSDILLRFLYSRMSFSLFSKMQVATNQSSQGAIIGAVSASIWSSHHPFSQSYVLFAHVNSTYIQPILKGSY